MNRILLSAAIVSILATGCGRAALEAPARAERPAAAAARAADAEPSADAAAAEADAAPEADAPAEAAPARKPGDYVAYRFSGSFRKTPLTLTQRVVARDGDAVVVDVTLEGDGEREALRVRLGDAAATRGEVLGVTRLDGGRERPATAADYEKLMAKTTLAADANEAVLATEDVTVEVGGAPVACQKTSFRVRVGSRAATLWTLESAAFAWGDLGGEIRAEDGRVLYKAEIVDAGHGAAPDGAAVARSEDYDE